MVPWALLHWGFLPLLFAVVVAAVVVVVDVVVVYAAFEAKNWRTAYFFPVQKESGEKCCWQIGIIFEIAFLIFDVCVGSFCCGFVEYLVTNQDFSAFSCWWSCWGCGSSVGKASWSNVPQGGATELSWVWFSVVILELGKNPSSALCGGLGQNKCTHK